VAEEQEHKMRLAESIRTRQLTREMPSAPGGLKKKGRETRGGRRISRLIIKAYAGGNLLLRPAWSRNYSPGFIQEAKGPVVCDIMMEEEMRGHVLMIQRL